MDGLAAEQPLELTIPPEDHPGRYCLEMFREVSASVEDGACWPAELDGLSEDDLTIGARPVTGLIGGHAHDTCWCDVGDHDDDVPTLFLDVDLISTFDGPGAEYELLDLLVYVGGHLSHPLPYR